MCGEYVFFVCVCVHDKKGQIYVQYDQNNSSLNIYFSLRCYICDDEVQYSSTGQLAQLVNNLKKLISTDPMKRPQKSR